MMTDHDKNTTLILTMARELAQADADRVFDRPETPEEKAAIDRLDAGARDMLARLRREAFEEIRRTRPSRARPTMPARIMAMTIEAIRNRLRELEAQWPGAVQAAAYRKLDDMGLEELRALLADLEDVLGIAEAS
jgi:hypothetical protein